MRKRRYIAARNSRRKTIRKKSGNRPRKRPARKVTKSRKSVRRKHLKRHPNSYWKALRESFLRTLHSSPPLRHRHRLIRDRLFPETKNRLAKPPRKSKPVAATRPPKPATTLDRRKGKSEKSLPTTTTGQICSAHTPKKSGRSGSRLSA